MIDGEHKSEHEEVDIVDYIKVIRKRKWLVLVFFILGIIISLAIPVKYKVQTSLEIGEFIDEQRVLKKPAQLIEKIEGGIYGSYFGLKAICPRGTNLINLEITSKNPGQAKKNLADINNLILNEHNQKIEAKKEILKNSIEELQDKIVFLLSKNKEVEYLESEVVRIQKEINSIQNTKVIKEPAFSKKNPNFVFNLICGGVLGIFIGISLAFVKEWWEKNKYKIRL